MGFKNNSRLKKTVQLLEENGGKCQDNEFYRDFVELLADFQGSKIRCNGINQIKILCMT